MLHARKDYNERIQDSKSIIPDDEPVFLLRGKDVFAPSMLKIYATLVKLSAFANRDIIRNTEKHYEAMILWQKEHGWKQPDMNPEDSVY